MMRSLIGLGLLIYAASTAAAGTLKLGEIVRIKGQETNTLQGLGLVVGLSGTGDAGALPTARALSRMMQLMGGPMAVQPDGLLDLRDVSDAENVAMVFVTATVPDTGVQAGDVVDVKVHAVSAESLRGGTLMTTPLLGPRADQPTVYATAQGPVTISPDGNPTTGTVGGGAKMERDVETNYVADNRVTLILRSEFANFETANRIESEINSYPGFTLGLGMGAGGGNAGGSGVAGPDARAVDPLHLTVNVPPVYRDNPVNFIALLMNMPIQLSRHDNRVVIDQREGVVVIGEDVEIAPVLITHRNLRISAGGPGFVTLGDGRDEPPNPKLQALADALNTLDVPTSDLIAIIKTLQSKGDLFGEIIYR